MRRPMRLAAVLMCLAAGPLLLPGGAHGSIAQPTVVSVDPVNYTPNVEDDAVVGHTAVYALAQLGQNIYAGGTFHTVKNAALTTSYTRYNIMGFDATSGALTSFAPVFNAQVWALQPGGGTSLYVGGDFTTVNGAAHRGLVKIDTATGDVDPTFNPVITSGNVTEIRLVNNRLIIGGSFPKRLAALDPVTGADTGYISATIAGSVATNAGATHVYRFAVDPAGTRLVALGNFTTVNGNARSRAFMLDLGATSSSLDQWYYQPLQNMCRASSLPQYLRDVDFSPDGSYFVFASTGYIPQIGGVGRDLCDAATRFETNISAPLRPTWINYTGGDTLHSVAATGSAVYVNGHNRWLDNPSGADTCLTTCVSRPGIGAIDPATGRALAWNPTKTRGVGGKDLLVTTAGLWVASDGKRFHGEYRHDIAFCPL